MGSISVTHTMAPKAFRAEQQPLPTYIPKITYAQTLQMRYTGRRKNKRYISFLLGYSHYRHECHGRTGVSGISLNSSLSGEELLYDTSLKEKKMLHELWLC